MAGINLSALLNMEQKIQYAKGKSDTVAKLDGTFKIPVSALAAAAGNPADDRSELQKSIFAAPPGSVAAREKEKSAELSSKADEAHGVKRPRDEEDDDAMDEDDDGDAEMEMDESD